VGKAAKAEEVCCEGVQPLSAMWQSTRLLAKVWALQDLLQGAGARAEDYGRHESELVGVNER
jgi:hypothetical protein